jgi:hypothetical protein
MRAVHELAEAGSTLSSEEMCSRLKDAVSLLPEFLSARSCGASRNSSADGEAGAPTVVGADYARYYNASLAENIFIFLIKAAGNKCGCGVELRCCYLIINLYRLVK